MISLTNGEKKKLKVLKFKIFHHNNILFIRSYVERVDKILFTVLYFNHILLKSMAINLMAKEKVLLLQIDIRSCQIFIIIIIKYLNRKINQIVQ